MSSTKDKEFSIPLADRVVMKEFFKQEGYVVVRNAIPKDRCEQANAAFIRDVKSDRGYFKRQESGRYERHTFTQEGFMKYPIMNIQNLSAPQFQEFRQLGLKVLTHPNIQDVVTILLGEPGKIIQTQFFEGNPQTWAHRDGDTIDSEEVGRQIGLWVATEDIHPGAGRFFVYARSHLAPISPIDNTIPNSHEYRKLLTDFATSSRLRLVAPELKQGDAILWTSLTIHGSLETTASDHSRRSFTAFYIPISQEYRVFRQYHGSSQGFIVNGVMVKNWGDHNRISIQTIAALQNAAIALLILSPVLLIVAIAIAMRMGRPVIFTQPRPGKDGRVFTFYKFRTMTDERDSQGNLLPDEQRLIPFGQFLRKTSLDELPQFWNILQGDMNFVGPRPLLVDYLERYSPEQARRHEVRPGITGLAQINGRNAISWEEKFKLDVWYIDNWSLWLDLTIIFLTVFKVLQQEGIDQKGYISAEEFKGKLQKTFTEHEH